MLIHAFNSRTNQQTENRGAQLERPMPIFDQAAKHLQSTGLRGEKNY
jgi:hypothetical protein